MEAFSPVARQEMQMHLPKTSLPKTLYSPRRRVQLRPKKKASLLNGHSRSTRSKASAMQAAQSPSLLCWQLQSACNRLGQYPKARYA